MTTVLVLLAISAFCLVAYVLAESRVGSGGGYKGGKR
jgi:hypothetical protein